MNEIKIKSDIPDNVLIYDIGDFKDMFYMYLPIKSADSDDFVIPEQLGFVNDVIDDHIPEKEYINRYVYVTLKTMQFVPVSDNEINRHIWHVDGYGTNDINYIWSDMAPPEFAIQDFFVQADSNIQNILDTLEEQINVENVQIIGNNRLIKLEQNNVHKMSEMQYEGTRKFLKISISDRMMAYEETM